MSISSIPIAAEVAPPSRSMTMEEPMPLEEFGRLLNLLLEAEVAPSMATGDFYRKGLEIAGWRARLEFLNRGQLWVAGRIAAALPRIPPSAGKSALQAMHESHLVNIALCEQLLAN